MNICLQLNYLSYLKIYPWFIFPNTFAMNILVTITHFFRYRDFDYMSGLSIVQACLAMNFYKALPESLINRVFNIEFIKRLEDEIEMCYSKVKSNELLQSLCIWDVTMICIFNGSGHLPRTSPESSDAVESCGLPWLSGCRSSLVPAKLYWGADVKTYDGFVNFSFFFENILFF